MRPDLRRAGQTASCRARIAGSRNPNPVAFRSNHLPGVRKGVNSLPEKLDALIDVMCHRGMPHRRWLADGLLPTEVEERLATAGLPANAEVCAWFSWANGAIDPAGDLDGVRPALGLLNWRLLTLEEALAKGEGWRAVFDGQAADEEPEIGALYEDNPWGSRWLPLLTSAGSPMIGAALDTDPAIAPVVFVDGEVLPDEWEWLPSISALVEQFTTQVDQWYYQWDPRHRSWTE